MTPLAGALYDGWVQHRRRGPRPHAFRYPLCFLGLDLDHARQTLRALPWAGWRAPAWARYHRADYCGDTKQDLAAYIRQIIREQTGKPLTGSVELITHLRQGGHCFNPVSFYRCRHADGSHRCWVVDITNTPWGQHHAYVLDSQANIGTLSRQRYVFAKDFHVSPFMPMHQIYDWHFHVSADRLTVHMITRERGQPVFDATFSGRVRRLSPRRFQRSLIRFPLQTVQVVARIYLQALRLALKRTPFFAHPMHAAAA